MEEKKYKLSYTAGALLLHESVIAVETYFEVGDWTKTKKMLIDENRLQMRMESSTRRIGGEVIQRLKTLTDNQLSFFQTASRRDQIAILWLSICKNYKFIADFAIEIIREKYLRMDYMLQYNDYEIFFYNKCEWHPELESLTDSTQKKVQQVLFKMLREADIIDASNIILGAILSDEFIELVKKDKKATLAVFPVPENIL